MRSYLYISDSKVDSYLGQKNKAEKKKLAARLKLNLGVIEGEVGTDFELLANRVQRLNAVEALIREYEPVGAVDSGMPWIEGAVDAIAATFDPNKNIMFYFSAMPRHLVALAGSAHHIIGNVRPAVAVASMSHVPALLFNLEQFVEKYGTSVQKSDKDLEFAVYESVSVAPGGRWADVLAETADQFKDHPTERIGFLARRLIPDEVLGSVICTLASPLYLTSEDVAVSPTELKAKLSSPND